MPAASARFFTAGAVILCCLWTVTQGVDFIRFKLSIGSAASNGIKAASLNAWAEKTGLAGGALEGLLHLPFAAAGRDLSRHRQELLIRFLANDPLASQMWLSLAAIRNSPSADPADVDAAIIMSDLTGPNEGEVMAQRALLGFILWEKISPEGRARTVIDFCGSAFDALQVRLVFSSKPEALRSEIRAALRANGCTDRTITFAGL